MLRCRGCCLGPGADKREVAGFSKTEAEFWRTLPRRIQVVRAAGDQVLQFVPKFRRSKDGGCASDA